MKAMWCGLAGGEGPGSGLGSVIHFKTFIFGVIASTILQPNLKHLKQVKYVFRRETPLNNMNRSPFPCCNVH